MSQPAWLLERHYRLSKMSFVGRIVSTAAQVVAGWAAPLFALGVNALAAATPSVALRTLLECLGKADKRREERDQSGQKSHEINQIGHGHHLPSNGGRCPAHGTAVNDTDSIKAQLDMRMFVRISEDRSSGMAKEQFLCHTRACRRTANYIFRVIRPRYWFCINAPPGLSEGFCPYLSVYMPICALTSPNQTPLEA